MKTNVFVYDLRFVVLSITGISLNNRPYRVDKNQITI